MKVQLQRRRGGHDKGSTIDVPEYIGERMVERGDATKAENSDDSSKEPSFPDGKPAESWKVGQLAAWAKANDLDLGDATKKDDVWRVVADRLSAGA